MLILEHISKSYIRHKRVFNALQDISLTFEDYSFNFIVCEDKLNSESIFNIIGGLDTFDNGSISIDGVKYDANSSKFINTYAKDNVGVIFKDDKVFKGLTVEENLKIATSIIGEKKGITIDEALDKVGIKELKKKRASKLTNVEKIKVAIARALVKNPKVLLVHELFENMSNDYSSDILSLLKKLSKERIVIVITKDEKLANISADRIIRMNSKIIFDNSFSFEEEYVDPSYEQEKYSYVKRTKADAFFSVVRAALQSAKKHWFKVFSVVLLLTLTMVCFSFAIILAQYDSEKYALDYFTTTDAQALTLRPYGKLKKDFDAYAQENLQGYAYEEVLSIRDAEQVSNGNLSNHIFGSKYIYNKMRGEDYALHIEPNNVVIWSDNLKTNFNLKVVEGRYPESDREIAMTDTIFNFYKAFGYEDGGVIEEINSYKDLIGKEVYNCEVVGIINTGIEPFDVEAVYKLDKKQRDNVYKWTDSHYVYSDSIHSSYFVTQNCYNRFFLPANCYYYTSQRFGYSNPSEVHYARDYFGYDILVQNSRPMEANEVFVGDLIIDKLLKAQSYDSDSMMDYQKIQAIADNDIKLMVLFNNTDTIDSILMTFDIVGCISGGSNDIVFADSFAQSFTVSQEPLSYAVQLKHTEEDLKFTQMYAAYWYRTSEDAVFVEGQNEGEWGAGASNAGVLSYFGAAASFILGIFAIWLLVSTCRSIAKDNKSLVLTLKASGVREQRILDMIYIEMLIIAVIGIVGGIGASFGVGFAMDSIFSMHKLWMVEGMNIFVMGMIALFVLASIGVAYGISRIWYKKTFAIKIDKKW